MSAQKLEKIVNKYRDINTSPDAKILQITLWAEAVLFETGKSAYFLERQLTELDVSNEGVIRFFKNIKKGFKPSRNHSRRSIDFVNSVDSLYGLTELKEMFYSPFWYVISSKFYYHASHPETIRLILAEVFAICRHNSKSTSDIEEYFEFAEPLRFNRKNPALKKFKVPDCLKGSANFDQLAVLGLMYREAYIGCSIAYAMTIREMFLKKLYEVIAKPYIKESRKKELFELATNRLLNPISQIRRNKANNMQKSFNKTKIKFPDQDKLISFLKSHDKSVQFP